MNFEELSNVVGELDEERMVEILEDVMKDGGSDAQEAMDACQKGMDIIGEFFDTGEYFVSDLIYAGELMTEAVEILRPALAGEGGGSNLGKMILCTVADDLHDIGKNIVKAMLDLRRRPEKVLETLEATYPVVAPSPMPKKSFPWQFYPVVSVTYLNRKNFEKFFWPTFKRSVDTILSTGGKVCVCMEGKWGHVYDMFLEFPKGSIVAFLEDDDLIEAKKKIGDKVALAGGLKAQLMKDGTRQENIEAVRRILGECGNEGVMLSLNKCLLSPGDVNPDNLAAVSDFVRSYSF